MSVSWLKNLFNKKQSEQEQDIQKFLTDFQYLNEEKSSELLEYFKILREMIKNFNNMILDVSFKGGALLITIIAATTYLPIKDGVVGSIFSLLILIGALIICCNLEAQVVFFSNMMRVSIRITNNIEKLLLSVKDGENFKIPIELFVTEKLKTYFPGKKYVVRRGKLFKYLKYILYLFLFVTIFKIGIDLNKELITTKYPILVKYLYADEKNDVKVPEKNINIENNTK